LAGTALPSQPEELMRSRYTAFCKGNVDYLIATHHPTQRQPDDRQTLAETGRTTEWLSLRVQGSSQSIAGEIIGENTREITGDIGGNRGTVTFVTFYRHQGTVGQLHERSTFLREDGRWYYVTGVRLEPIAIRRNDPCWCGSGRKLKQCHKAMPTLAQSL